MFFICTALVWIIFHICKFIFKIALLKRRENNHDIKKKKISYFHYKF